MEKPGRNWRHRARRASLLASATLAAAMAVADAAQAQDLRGTVAQAREAPAYDPTATVPGVGVGKPIDPSAIYASPSGATPSGATSRRAPRRAARPVRGGEKIVTNKPVRPPLASVSGLPDPMPPPLLKKWKPVVEEDPFAAPGITLGSLVLRPALTVYGGYDDNPDRVSTGKKGSTLLRTEGELKLKSDWSVHELTGELKGGYSRYFAVPDASRPEMTGKLGLRLDILRDTIADFETRMSLDTQRPGSPELGTSVVGRPQIYAYGATAGITQNFHPVSLSLRGTVDRTTYADAKLSSGSTLSQADRDLTQYGARLRASYEMTPGLKPFVEAGVDTRVFDRTVDSAGYRRASDGLTGRVGSSFELTRLLTGEASVGYQVRRYDDPRLSELRGLIADASLVWTVSELTSVTLRGSTELADTTIPGVNGSTARRAEVKLAHSLQRNLTLTGTAGWSQTDYNGIALKEDTLTLGTALDWKLSRSVAVRASFTHERLNSTATGSDYTANVYLLGLRLQI